MKTRIITTAFFGSLLTWVAPPAVAEESIPLIFESGSEPLPEKLVWKTEPGVRYDLWESTDLAIWTQIPGYPAAASGLAMEHAITPEVACFFRIISIDEQPPAVERVGVVEELLEVRPAVALGVCESL